MQQEKFLEMKNINKRYGGVHALKNVDFSLDRGEVHCLVGENGSGKSTLIKVISGVETPSPDSRITIKGEILKGLTPIQSVEKGIQVIYQDLSLFPNLSVSENVSISDYHAGNLRFIKRKDMKKKALETMRKIDVSIDPDKLVRELPIAQKQVVAIVRALATDAELLIMDEPTASLSKHEIDELLKLIKTLQKNGITIVFVSHKLDEITSISDKVTVLRDGVKIGTYDAAELDDKKIAYLMTGEEFENEKGKVKKEFENKILEIDGLGRKRNYRDISFSLHKGEILGITGLIGSGRTELALTLFGMNRQDSGSIKLNGTEVSFKSNFDAIQAGIAYVPEDRLSEGLILPQPISNNIVLGILDKLVNRANILNMSNKEEIAAKWIKNIGVKTSNPENAVDTLSGGNQQKVVVSKWLATNPDVLILDNPTVGVDIAAKHGIYKIMREFTKKNLGIILISDEVAEVYQNSDRILIMSKGRIVEEVYPCEITEKELNEKILRGDINGQTA